MSQGCKQLRSFAPPLTSPTPRYRVDKALQMPVEHSATLHPWPVLNLETEWSQTCNSLVSASGAAGVTGAHHHGPFVAEDLDAY